MCLPLHKSVNRPLCQLQLLPVILKEMSKQPTYKNTLSLIQRASYTTTIDENSLGTNDPISCAAWDESRQLRSSDLPSISMLL